eukprot:224104_1
MANIRKIQIDLMHQNSDINTQIQPHGQRFHSRVIGFICVLLCVITWIGMCEIEPLLFVDTFKKPYFLNYCTNSSLIFMIVPWFIVNIMEKAKVKNKSQPNMKNYHTVQDISYKQQISIVAMYKKLLIPSIIVSLLLFFENYFWLISLYYTIAAVNTTIYQSQCIFVLVFSVFMLNKKLTVYNVSSVILSTIGVILTSFFGHIKESDSNVDPNTYGIICCLLAALLFALFQVSMDQIEIKYFDQNDEYNKFKNMLFFQFLMGVNVLLLCWPLFFILDYFSLETFEFPNNDQQWISILILTSLAFIYCISILIGICYCGATFMSIGTLLVIPLTYIVDTYLYNLIITPISIIGSMFVIIGFVIINVVHK